MSSVSVMPTEVAGFPSPTLPPAMVEIVWAFRQKELPINNKKRILYLVLAEDKERLIMEIGLS